MTDRSWQDQAICAQTDLEVFFPAAGAPAAAAQRVCLGCPVRVTCLQFALDQGIDHGVFGGTTPQMRRRLRQAA